MIEDIATEPTRYREVVLTTSREACVMREAVHPHDDALEERPLH